MLALSALRVTSLGAQEQTAQRMVRSVCRVADHADSELSPDLYRDIQKAMAAAGEDVEPLHRVIRYYGSWRLAKEAAALAPTTTARRIDARFRSRRVGKVWRYTEQTLESTLRRCIKTYGRAVTVAEFDLWRQREIALAQSRGDLNAHVPSATPYRRRWGSWEQALEHFGITADAATSRFPGS